MEPNIELNAKPQRRYEIVVTVNDPPGAFDRIDARADFQVKNESCIPQAPISGARPVPRTSAPVALEQAADGSFRGTIYLDLVKDQDYFGLGTCEWSIVAIGIGARIREGTFTASLFKDDLLAGRKVTSYFPKQAYEMSAKEFDISGDTDSTRYGTPDSSFSITVHAMESDQ